MSKLVKYQGAMLPSRWERAKTAVRAYWQGPFTLRDPHPDFFSHPSSAGVSVTESTALSYSAVWAAVSIISSQLASLPLCLYKKQSDGGKTKFIGHPLYRMLHDRPNPEMSSMVFRETLQAHVLTWGNAYAEIQRNGGGNPEALWPITPDRVTPFRNPSGILTYRVANIGGGETFIASDDMLHVPGLGFNGICGYGVIDKMRESIGLGLATEKFGATFFGNGSTFGGVFSHPGRMSDQARKNFIDSVNSRHKGIDLSHKFMVVEEDMKYTRFGIEPDHAQFLETRTFQIDEVARWLNLPPHKLKQLMRSTNNNIEHQNLEYYIDCLAPWAERWEQELSYKLIAPSERNIQEIEHVTAGLLRGDAAGRGTFYSQRFNTGSITPNRINELENENPVEGGDQAFVQLAYIPMSLSREWYLADIDEKKAKAEQARRKPEPPTITPPPAGRDDAAIALLTEARDTARRCAQEAEDAKDVMASELAVKCSELARAQSERDAVIAERADAVAFYEQRLQASHAELTSAQRDYQDIKALSEHTHRDNERLTAQATSLGADLARATEDVQTAEREAVDQRKRAVEAESQRDVVTQERDAAVALSELAATESAGLREELVSVRADVEAAKAETTRAAEQIATLVAEAERMTAVHVTASEAHQTEASTLRSHLATVTEELTSVTASLQEARTAIGTLQTARESDRATAATEAQRLAEARTHADEVNQATVTELRSQLATLTQELAAATASLFEVRTSLGAAEGARESVREAWTAADQEATRQSALVEQFKTRLTATQQAIRGAVAYEAERLILRETERARKAQGSPEKLGAWIHTFYPIHEDFCRTALKPAVRAALVAYGSEASVERVLDSVVLSHISESSRQLQAVIQDSDIESLGPSLERVLRRWEAERAEALADRILKEAV